MKITSSAPIKSDDVRYLFKAAVFTTEAIYLSKAEFVYADALTLCKSVLETKDIDERFEKLS